MEALVASGRFMNKELKEINCCRIYLQAFFISYIMNLEGKRIKKWTGRVQSQVGCHSTRDWTIQQCPTAWKAWKMAIKHLAPDGHIREALGDWRSQNHKIIE
jgi:hypothetical protein